MREIVKKCVVVLAACLTSASAQAASACYTPEQIHAEQLLRLHSELMVITVTCRQSSQGQDLPAAYGSFTKKNIGILHDAEQTMISYYKAHERGDATGRLDRLRTILGNEYGQKIADMGAPAFCGAYRDMVVAFNGAAPADIENEVQRMQVAERSYAAPCGVAKVAQRR